MSDVDDIRTCNACGFEWPRKLLDSERSRLDELQKGVKAIIDNNVERGQDEDTGYLRYILTKSGVVVEIHCAHEWTDARNEVVTSGEICLKCNTIRHGNRATGVEITEGAVSVVKPQGTEETGKDRPAAPISSVVEKLNP